MKISVLKGSPFVPLKFGANTISHYGKPAVMLLVILFVIIWYLLVSLFGVFEKSAEAGLNFPDILGVTMLHLVFVFWALFVAINMVPKIIALARLNRMRNRPRLVPK